MATGRIRWSLGALVLSAAISAAEPPAPTFHTALAIQDALRRGREFLTGGKAEQAVQLLEVQLPYINGNTAYLALLREAYGEAIKKAELEHRDDLAADWRQRVKILEQGAPAAVSDPSKPLPVKVESTATPLADAEREFGRKNYRQAAELFARAFAESPAVAKSHAAPWAYCKLFVAHERLARNDADAAALADLELDVAMAMSMMAGDNKMDALGRQLQAEIRQRRGSGAAPKIEVRHTDRGAETWARSETPSFRLYHLVSRDRAEQILRAAEAARAAAFAKWSEKPAGAWNPVCDVYLHPTAEDYARASGKGGSTPGHSTYQVQGGAIVRRRLDLRADDLNLLSHVMPHECTHLVVGELLADVSLPRWADEAMAVLAEPDDQVERYSRTLHRCRANGELVPLAQLLRQADYPDAKRITAFYVESVSVAQHLISESDPKAFLRFLRDAGRGLDAALEKHYRCRDVAELQDRWLRKTFTATDARGSSHP